MSNVTAVYCLKNKKDRNNVQMYCELAEVINRQIAQGGELYIQGLYEAKKGFRCENLDPRENDFKIAKGEYFLLVDGESSDATRHRLHRACRSWKEESKTWPLTGVPDNEAVYASSEEVEFDLEKFLSDDGGDDDDAPEVDENDYIRELDVEIPSILENVSQNEDVSANYLTFYQIQERMRNRCEDIWGISAYNASDFTDPATAKFFQQLIKCHTPQDIENIKDYPLLTEAIVKFYEENHGDQPIEPHRSIVIGVIDGKTKYWNCGIWYYKALDCTVTITPVQDFVPDYYEVIGDCLVPGFKK